jgi:hypothetical protein
MDERMSWDELRRHRAAIPADVAHRALGDETVLLNVATSTYFSIDEIGGRFLARMTDAPSLGVACAELSVEYEQPPERIAEDLAAFVHELRARGLIALEPASA